LLRGEWACGLGSHRELDLLSDYKGHFKVAKPKELVFLSHITEEKALADIVKDHIERDFIGLVDVFVSSDDRSIPIGEKWLADIESALKTAAAMIILCSNESVKRPWINFEAGAAWVREILIAPVCHTGMRPGGLPIPLQLLQGIEASNVHEWERLYRTIAGRLGSHTPPGRFSDLVAQVVEFEHDYGFIRQVRQSILALLAVRPEMRKLFAPGSKTTRAGGELPSHVIDQMRAPLDSLQGRGLLKYSLGSIAIMAVPGKSGTYMKIQVEIDPSYQQIAERVMAGV
jgi:hypothetical protein